MLTVDVRGIEGDECFDLLPISQQEYKEFYFPFTGYKSTLCFKVRSDVVICEKARCVMYWHSGHDNLCCSVCGEPYLWYGG